MMVEFVSANPTGPAARGPRRGRRRWATRSATCYATQGWDVSREFYYNDAGVQIATLAPASQLRAKGFKPRRPRVARERPTTATTSPTSPPTSWPATPCARTTASSRRRATSTTSTASACSRWPTCATSRTWTCARSTCDSTTTSSSPASTRSGKVDAAVQKLRAAGKTYEHDGALWLQSTEYGDDKDRVMRKSDGSYTYFVPDVAYHLTKCERGFATRSTSRAPTTTARSPACAPACRRPARRSPPAIPTTCCTRWCASMRGGQEVKISKRAGSYVTLRDLIEWTSKDAVRFFLLCASPTPNSCSTSTWRWRRTTTTRSSTCSTRMRASARCSPAWAAMRSRLGDADLSLAWQSPQRAGADAAAGAAIPEMLARRGGGPRAARRRLLPARPGRRVPQLLRRRALPGRRRAPGAGPPGAARGDAPRSLRNGLAVLGVSAPAA